MNKLSLIRVLLITLLCVSLLAGVFTYAQEATEVPTEQATAEATESPTEEATAEATAAPTSESEATAEVTEAATEEATEEAVEEATAEATEEAVEAETEEAAEIPTGGVTTLVLLLGMGAVVAVGGLMLARNNASRGS